MAQGMKVWLMCVTWRKLQTPGTAEEHKRHLQSTQTTVNRHNAQTKHLAISKGQSGGQDTRTPISTAAVYAFSTATTRHHYPHPTGSSLDPLSQRSPLRSTGRLSRSTQQTPPASAGIHSAPPPGRPSSGVADGQSGAPGLLLRRGRGEWCLFLPLQACRQWCACRVWTGKAPLWYGCYTEKGQNAWHR